MKESGKEKHEQFVLKIRTFKMDSELQADTYRCLQFYFEICEKRLMAGRRQMSTQEIKQAWRNTNGRTREVYECSL